MKWEPAGKHAPGGKGKKNGLLIAVVVVVAIAIIGGISRCGGGGEKNESLEWPTTDLATMLPKPSSDKGEVHTNSDETFWADVNEFSQSDFDAYVEQCKEKGFTVEASNDGLGFEAYSENGAHLRLTYLESSEEMSINLDAAVEMGTITWPTMGAGSLVPAPTSTTGVIDSDSSTFFSATIGETSQDDFSAYVDACIAAGFNVDYSKGDDTFFGDAASGNHVNVSYEGANMMTITVNAADEPAELAETETPAESEPTTERPATPATPVDTTTGTASDFRTMVDEYEAFMNKYCDFMETYNSDSGNVVSMALDYADMMSQYSDWAEKMDAADDSDLSAEDVQYYIDAQSRINKRLLEIGADA